MDVMGPGGRRHRLKSGLDEAPEQVLHWHRLPMNHSFAVGASDRQESAEFRVEVGRSKGLDLLHGRGGRPAVVPTSATVHGPRAVVAVNHDDCLARAERVIDPVEELSQDAVGAADLGPIPRLPAGTQGVRDRALHPSRA